MRKCWLIGWAALGAALFLGPLLMAGCSGPRALDADAMVNEWQIRNAGDWEMTDVHW